MRSNKVKNIDDYLVLYEVPRKMNGDKSNYLFTHFTTNLSPEMLKENYGERVVDRIKEMFNIVTFYGKSRRK